MWKLFPLVSCKIFLASRNMFQMKVVYFEETRFISIHVFVRHKIHFVVMEGVEVCMHAPLSRGGLPMRGPSEARQSNRNFNMFVYNNNNLFIAYVALSNINV
jgi:hypothetical protein